MSWSERSRCGVGKPLRGPGPTQWLVERAEAGEEVTILRRGRAVAKLVPAGGPKKGLTPEALQRLRDLRASMPIYEDPEGLSFVERMRREDQL